MAEVFRSAIPEDTALTEAEHALARGDLVVVPTDTVYGLAAQPNVPGATQRVFEVKGRSRDLILPVLVADVDDAAEIAVLDERTRTLAADFWPGGLTLIVPRTAASEGWDLGDAGGTVGIRVPDHEMTLSLLARTGPLAVTSANRSGEPTPDQCEELVAALGEGVAIYLCAGPARHKVPSSIVDLTHAPPRVIRHGAVPLEAIREVLGEVE